MPLTSFAFLSFSLKSFSLTAHTLPSAAAGSRDEGVIQPSTAVTTSTCHLANVPRRVIITESSSVERMQIADLHDRGVSTVQGPPSPYATMHDDTPRTTAAQHSVAQRSIEDSRKTIPCFRKLLFHDRFCRLHIRLGEHK